MWTNKKKKRKLERKTAKNSYSCNVKGMVSQSRTRLLYLLCVRARVCVSASLCFYVCTCILHWRRGENPSVHNVQEETALLLGKEMDH